MDYIKGFLDEKRIIKAKKFIDDPEKKGELINDVMKYISKDSYKEIKY